jgi:hypothetical protein
MAAGAPSTRVITRHMTARPEIPNGIEKKFGGIRMR